MNGIKNIDTLQWQTTLTSVRMTFSARIPKCSGSSFSITPPTRTSFGPTQGVVSLVLGTPLGFQPDLGKVKSVVRLNSNPQKEPPDFQA